VKKFIILAENLSSVLTNKIVAENTITIEMHELNIETNTYYYSNCF